VMANEEFDRAAARIKQICGAGEPVLA
jgi:hypothetical protein